ncbi:hypothetical protein H2203_008432 [Taxawa tesnikishii (nom. ined.)]|nr:hypothetical protein H2203_008432 [Dothideales sp. JES 119]
MGVSKTPAVPESGSKTSSDPPKVGDTIELQGFGGEIETNDGEKVTLQALVEKSDAGVVLFTYPKASTPGCTNQACLFRDSFEPLTKTGLSIFGLSTDSPKANTTFKTKQKLPYTLLCDPQTSLIAAIGFKKSPKGTQRGVFVVQKDGKVLAAEPGGPAATVEVVKGVVDSMGGTDADGEKALEKAEVRATEAEGDEVESDKKMADTAGEVADTAEKLEDSRRQDAGSTRKPSGAPPKQLLNTVPPPRSSSDYLAGYESIAASILYRSPLPSQSGLPIYILNAAAFPDAFEVDYDALLPYVLARLPGEEELIAGAEYEIIFFAGGQPESATSEKKTGPGVGWYLQAYHVLSRATRKRLKKLWVVHERSWVRVLIEVFGTIVSPKFRKKIVHVTTLSGLALHVPIEILLIPASAYLYDRRLASDIYAPYASGRRAFSANDPLPKNIHGERRLPRVLRETTSFLCLESNLRIEGLFRIPPHSLLLSIVREAYDRGQQFIVWKEGPASLTQPDVERKTVDEIPPTDAYGLHLATGLIKVWYRELRTPVFTESCYEETRTRFGAVDTDISLKDLADMISPDSTRSFLSPTARLILTTHLLPLLSLVASYEKYNKMSAENLAICFAPALVCGSDQLADAKMSSIIRKILKAAVEAWPNGLREASKFRRFESHRIILQDDEGEPQEKPPLPPRPSSQKGSDSEQVPRRKPAPAVSVLPRYSALIDNGDYGVLDSPASYVANGFVPQGSQTGSYDSVGEKQEQQAGLISPKQRMASYDGDATSKLGKSHSFDLPSDVGAISQSPIEPVRRKPVVPSPSSSVSERKRSVSGGTTQPTGDSGFVKPTWAASSRQNSGQKTGSASSLPSQQKSHTALASSATPYAPKPRTPSPGLLKRMPSTGPDHESATAGKINQPRTLDMQKKSVDDLRRLYEERAGTVVNLANAARRASNTSLNKSDT